MRTVTIEWVEVSTHQATVNVTPDFDPERADLADALAALDGFVGVETERNLGDGPRRVRCHRRNLRAKLTRNPPQHLEMEDRPAATGPVPISGVGALSPLTCGNGTSRIRRSVRPHSPEARGRSRFATMQKSIV